MKKYSVTWKDTDGTLKVEVIETNNLAYDLYFNTPAKMTLFLQSIILIEDEKEGA